MLMNSYVKIIQNTNKIHESKYKKNDISQRLMTKMWKIFNEFMVKKF